MSENKRRLGVLISGGASTAAAIHKVCGTEVLPDIEIAVVIASKEGAGAHLRALPNHPEIIELPRKLFKSRDDYGRQVLSELKRCGVDCVGQYGWLPITANCVIEAFPGRIWNQHPGPLPEFGGSGMDGIRVHCARLQFARVTGRDFWTEVVTHMVTEIVDGGAVVKSGRVEITPDDNCRTLNDRALKEEYKVQIEFLRDFCDGKVHVVEQKVLVLPGEEPILEAAKQYAKHHQHPD